MNPDRKTHSCEKCGAEDFFQKQVPICQTIYSIRLCPKCTNDLAKMLCTDAEASVDFCSLRAIIHSMERNSISHLVNPKDSFKTLFLKEHAALLKVFEQVELWLKNTSEDVK